MRWILITLLLALPMTGCSKKKKSKFFPPPKTGLTVDQLIVEGTVTDTFDTAIDVRLDGTPLTVAGGAFTADLDATAASEFVFEAEDDAGNITERRIIVE